jgi:type II secretory pathway pseudopilin PulG
MFYKFKGFTLIETVISIGIMGLIIVSVLSVFVTGLNAIKERRNESEISSFATGKINQLKTLFIKYPDYNYDIAAKIPLIITGDFTFVSPSPAILWKDPPGSCTDLKVEGSEYSYKFSILVQDYYDGTSYNYEIKKLTVKVKEDGPQAQELTMITLIAVGLQ